MAEHFLLLLDDNGNNLETNAFWIGYYEIFKKAEITIFSTYEDDLVIEF